MKTILVGVYVGELVEAMASMAELKELAKTAELNVVDTIIQRRKLIDPKTLIGKGKLAELIVLAQKVDAELIVFDRELTPAQLRAITSQTELKVIDRSMLILDIFANRAKSSEGRLQVELAQLKYSLPRLTDQDSGLSRLTGGIGGRGPGETKLEISRRRVRDRIHLLEERIEKVSHQRQLRRERRKNNAVPIVAVVGYTNSGKSTLVNTLTNSSVLSEDKLFATLDTVTRRLRFPNEQEIIFVDTVGFIRELPKELMPAFKATLEEIAEADVLLHVVDATNPELIHQIEIVNTTLKELSFGNKKRILVVNKIDKLPKKESRELAARFLATPVSALNKDGLDKLVTKLLPMLK